jgi:hypothetical protein
MPLNFIYDKFLAAYNLLQHATNFDYYELRLSHRQAPRMLTIETAPKMESL